MYGGQKLPGLRPPACLSNGRHPLWEDTGASFHYDIELLPEMYEGRKPSMRGAPAGPRVGPQSAACDRRRVTLLPAG